MTCCMERKNMSALVIDLAVVVATFIVFFMLSANTPRVLALKRLVERPQMVEECGV